MVFSGSVAIILGKMNVTFLTNLDFTGPFSTMCNHSARYFLQLLLKVRVFIELTPLFFSNQKLLDYCRKTNVNIFILFLVKIQLGTDFS